MKKVANEAALLVELCKAQHNCALRKHAIAVFKRLKQVAGSPVLGIEFCAPVVVG